MAIINQKTGYYGFTIDSTGGIPIDNNGRVNHVVFSIIYPVKINDIEFTISDGADDWGAQMGDDSIASLCNPQVLFQNKDNTIVQFDLNIPYPSNSPCVLVYRSDTAWFKIKEVTETIPWAPNTISGHFGFTVEGYGGTPSPNGCVNRVLCSIPYPNQSVNVDFTISDDPSHWGMRMGDGSIINLRSPVVIISNKDNAVVQFEMDTPYPSNSPCIMVYRSPDAWIKVKASSEDEVFVPVTDIQNIPEELSSGGDVDLSSAEIVPNNASVQSVIWSIVSGNATINGSIITTTAEGDLNLRATIIGGINESTDYVKDFNISVIKNLITIISQPDPNVIVVFNEIASVISINANADSGILKYQWYHNSIKSITGATPVGGSSSSYPIPGTLEKGDHYYYCEVSTAGSIPIRSEFSEVRVIAKLTGIEITPRTETLGLRKERLLSVDFIPADADPIDITWTTSDPLIVQINNDGKIFAVGSGPVAITAKTVDGKFSNTLDIVVAEFIPVKDITGTIMSIETGKPYTLIGKIVPEDATNKDVVWSLIDAGDTEATVENAILVARKSGRVIIRATITNGATLTSDFMRDITVDVKLAFVPITDINIIDLPTTIRVGDRVPLAWKVLPDNATNNMVTCSTISSGVTIEEGILSSTDSGTISIKATVLNGLTSSINYTKDFDVVIEPAWVAVSIVEDLPSEFQDFDHVLTLAGTVKPLDATYRDIIYELIDPSGAKAVINDQNQLSINPIDVEWYTKHPNPPTPADTWIPMRTSIIIGITIKNGIADGTDYTTQHSIYVVPPEPPEVFIPVTNIKLSLPSILRAWRPSIVDKSVIEPWNSTKKGFMWTNTRVDAGGADSVVFIPGEDTTSWSNMGVQFLPDFDYTFDGNYLYSFDTGEVILDGSVFNGLDYGTNYNQQWKLNFLPPYIAVKDILNIPTQIPRNTDIILSPECDTKGGTNHRTPTWDDSVPSYDNVEWSVHPDDESGAIITNNSILRCTKLGTAKIIGYVPQGTREEFMWHGNTYNRVAYSQVFEINVVSSEKTYDYPLMELTLKNSKKINAFKLSEIDLCRSITPSNTNITIDGETFRKDEVVSVKFWEDQLTPVPAKHIPVTGISEVSQHVNINIDGSKHNFINLSSAVVSPVTASRKKITWSIIPNTDSIKDSGKIEEDSDSGDIVLIPGADTGIIIVQATIKDGIAIGVDYVHKIAVSYNSTELYNIIGIECSSIVTNLIRGKDTEISVKANIIGTTDEYINADGRYGWELIGNYKEGTFISPYSGSTHIEDYHNNRITLTVDPYENIGTDIVIKMTPVSLPTDDGNVNTDLTIYPSLASATIVFHVIKHPILPPPTITCLSNFGRNMTSLTKIDRIPTTVQGEGCLRNFLMGCTLFNQDITIPTGISGNRCLEYFLRDCTKFNSNITAPDSIAGNRAMLGFLYGCSSYNKPFVIPKDINGEWCLHRFMMKCTKFNQELVIPPGISGNFCLESFLMNATSFNQPITIPDEITGDCSLMGFMHNCDNMVSTITISAKSSEIVAGNPLTLASYLRGAPISTTGVTIAGTGAETFKEKLPNTNIYLPHRLLK